MQGWGHEPPIEETALAQDTCGKGENDRGRLSEDEISVWMEFRHFGRKIVIG
jgi:hypothetical protein